MYPVNPTISIFTFFSERWKRHFLVLSLLSLSLSPPFHVLIIRLPSFRYASAHNDNTQHRPPS